MRLGLILDFPGNVLEDRLEIRREFNAIRQEVSYIVVILDFKGIFEDSSRKWRRSDSLRLKQILTK